jgi:cellobiose transport system permease protein
VTTLITPSERAEDARPTAERGAGARLRGRAPQDTAPRAWVYLALTVAFMFAAFPVYWMFVVATGTEASIAKIPPQLLPESHYLENLREVLGLQDVFLVQSLVNSAFVSTIVTVSVLFFCSLAGFAFAKLRFRGRHALMVFSVLTLTMPNQLGIVALYIVRS